MNHTAFLLIFSSIFLHAGWHTISKAQKPHISFFLIVSISSALLNLSSVLVGRFHYGDLPVSCFLCMVGGGICGAVSNAGLSLAYRNADVSLAYPLARALPVLLTILITACFQLGEKISLIVLFGMCVVVLGCFVMPMKSFSDFAWKNYWNKGLLGILIAALGTTGYTVIDGLGMKLIKQQATSHNDFFTTCAYSFMRETCIVIMFFLMITVIPEERKNFSSAVFCNKHAYQAGIIAASAYWLVLMASVHVTNVSYVQAFRQMSLPVGLLMGVLFLHEKCHFPKIAGMVLIVAGLIVTQICK